MAGPTLTKSQIDQLKKESAKAISSAETFASQIEAQIARANELRLVDSAFKAYFDYYDLDIIQRYDKEKQELNGDYIEFPITETDIIDCASLLGGRIQPSLPITDVIRVWEFDGGPLLNNPNNETQNISKQIEIEDALVNGYGGTAPGPTVLTTTSITSGTTTLNLSSPTTYTIALGSVFIVASGTDSAVFKVLTSSITPSTPFVATLTIELLSVTGTVPSGQNLLVFTGFNNSERSTKTSSDPKLQGLMLYLVSELELYVSNRVLNLINQHSQLSSNQDPDGVAEISQAQGDILVSMNFLDTYLLTVNISNGGLLSLSNERGIRSPQIIARISQINSAYTGRTQNYYNERYNLANNRANTARGSLRLQLNSEAGAATSAAYADTLGDQANALGSILP